MPCALQNTSLLYDPKRPSLRVQREVRVVTHPNHSPLKTKVEVYFTLVYKRDLLIGNKRKTVYNYYYTSTHYLPCCDVCFLFAIGTGTKNTFYCASLRILYTSTALRPPYTWNCLKFFPVGYWQMHGCTHYNRCIVWSTAHLSVR